MKLLVPPDIRNAHPTIKKKVFLCIEWNHIPYNVYVKLLKVMVKKVEVEDKDGLCHSYY